MEEKLEAYRRRKRKIAMINKTRNFINKFLPWTESHSTTLINKRDLVVQDENKEVEECKENVEEIEAESEEESEENDSSDKILFIKIVTYFLYFLLWLTLYLIAIQIEFGAVYFIISSLFLIWINTNTKPRKPGEVSAYSVFNPNCEAIDGTLNAEQFEREIRLGSMSVR